MFFSIILPIYKVEKYLAECVDSILAQDFRDYELILVDDGSPDASGIICDEYAKKDGRVVALHKENGGLSDARNYGTERAHGEYVIYVDSDDYVTSPTFLSDVKAKIDATGADVVLYKFSKLHDDTKKIDDCTFSLSFVEEIADSDELMYALVENDAYYGMAWIKAFRRSLVADGEIAFEKGLLGEDMDWYFNLILKAEKFAAIDRSYIAYRQRAGSITTTTKLKNLTDFIYILEKWADKTDAAAISDRKRAALRGALAKYYSNLLITYTRVADKEKKKYKKRIKALSRLLAYAISPRPKTVRKFYKILGFFGVTKLLAIKDKR